MPLRFYSLYDKTTGRFTGRTFGIDVGQDRERNEHISRHTPDGYAVIEGKFDSLSQRVDLSTKQVIDYQPEQPSAEHAWSVETRRWTLSPEAQQRKQARAAALVQIRDLEASQLRPLRELALDPTNAEARTRLRAIEAQIPKLRSIVNV